MFRFLFAPLCFLFVELSIILGHPKLYWRSVKRAFGYGRYPFHAYPRSADEKFVWRKIFDRDPVFTRISDKLELRNWLREMALDLQMTPVLWSGTSPHDIPDELLSGDVMIKPNHDSGTGMAMWNGPVSRADVIRRMEWALARDFGRLFGEWGYDDVPRRVFAEKRLGRDGLYLNDLKFYTFGRRIERLVHIQNRPDGRYGQVFEPDGQGDFYRLERAPGVCRGKIEVDLTGVFAEAVAVARDLGEPFDQMRVDLLEVDGDLWLSEMTIYNESGYLAEGGAYPKHQVSCAWDLRRSWALRTFPGGLLTRTYLRLLKHVLDRKAATAKELPPA